KCKPFFDAIKSKGKEVWGIEKTEALAKLKQCMAQLPMLSAPIVGEPLYLYLAVSRTATSAVLIREYEKKQCPVFYSSKTMTEVEHRYSKMKKIVLALIQAKRKLRHYFEAHPIIVPTKFSIRTILHKPDQFGRMVKWAIELGVHEITYEPRIAIKGQAVADFLLECEPKSDEE